MNNLHPFDIYLNCMEVSGGGGDATRGYGYFHMHAHLYHAVI